MPENELGNPAVAHRLATAYLARWRLRIDGPAARGAVALVLPVRCADGTPAALKLQPVDEETAGEPAALRAWAGRGAVRLLDHDPATGTMLLERLDATRSLSSVPDDLAALRILSELLARLVAVPAPPGVRRLADVAARMRERVPPALARLGHPDDRRLVRTCAAAVAELAPAAGDRLLHWDLHYDNVLARGPGPGTPEPWPGTRESWPGTREPWLAIDPKPLAGDPGFELLPALRNRWDQVTATGDVARAVRRRFDLMVDVLDLDRERAVGWTLGRVLQEALWQVEDGATALAPVEVAVARALLARTG